MVPPDSFTTTHRLEEPPICADLIGELHDLPRSTILGNGPLCPDLPLESLNCYIESVALPHNITVFETRSRSYESFRVSFGC